MRRSSPQVEEVEGLHLRMPRQHMTFSVSAKLPSSHGSNENTHYYTCLSALLSLTHKELSGRGEPVCM